jgi:serine/threonine-protein kinase
MRDVGQGQLIGRTIAGKFVIEELLGAGAMGAVFRARQVALEKTVAIKVLHGEHAHDATFAARFQREARAASRLNHPNSMQVIDFGVEPDGLLYIAMEYLHGRTLHRLLREEWPLPAARVADILMQTLAALAVAHDTGIVHRDLKPENVMVLHGTDDDGRTKDIVKVCDFGIAKITDSRAYKGSENRESNAPVTSAGFLVGTPEYMSPEQGRGEKLGPGSDLYSVGVILFEMLTRRVPFEAENAIGVVLKHITEGPTRPSQIAPGIEPRLEAICLRALRKAPEERYPSAREMRAELRQVYGDGLTARGTPRGTVVQRPAVTVPAVAPTAFMNTTGTARGTDEATTKPTLLGTASTVPGLPKRRAVVVAGAALTTGAVIAATALMMARPHVRGGKISLHVAAAAPAPPVSVAALDVAPPPLDIVRSEAPVPGTAGPRAIARGKAALGTGPGARPAALTSAGVPTSVAPQSSLPPVSAAPAPTLAPMPVAAAIAPPVAVPTADMVDPSFDPDRAYVEVGLVNAQGAREGAVRAAVRGVGLVRCYRGALRAGGTRATGGATLNLSFDETGVARSAIVTGADFLPGLARCIQTASAGVHIPKAQVDTGGGSAEVFLAFKIP